MEYINGFIDIVTSNPIYLGITIIILLLLFMSIARRLFKIAIILIIILACYIGYLAYQGKEPESVLQEKLEKLEDADLDSLKDAAEEVNDKLDD